MALVRSGINQKPHMAKKRRKDINRAERLSDHAVSRIVKRYCAPLTPSLDVAKYNTLDLALDTPRV